MLFEPILILLSRFTVASSDEFRMPLLLYWFYFKDVSNHITVPGSTRVDHAKFMANIRVLMN